MNGLRFFSRASDNSIVLLSYHPRQSLTWHWAVYLKRRAIYSNIPRWVHRSSERTNQWHDYYRLPFGWWLLVSYQDYHRRPAA